LRVVRLARQGIASSGRADDVVEIGGETYSRWIDPRTGIGALNVRPVTAVARTAWRADAMARAAAVLGEADAPAMMRTTPNVKVWFHRAAGTARDAGVAQDSN
jgi:thiamine biosynthesis lipoprotein ApbE